MRREPPAFLLIGCPIVLAGLLLVASSTTTHEAGEVTLLAAGPYAVPEAPAVPLDAGIGLATLAQQATNEAAHKGADISFDLLDRQTGQIVSSGDPKAFPLASVAKLFIADDLLWQVAEGRTQLSPDDRRGLDLMLRSSDDFAANEFWSRGGGNAVVSRVVGRYGLTGTTPPYDGNWWSTMSTTADLVRYYDRLLDGAGGLPPQQAETILSDLSASTPIGVDGYPQRFGIPDGLFAEPVAVKQGWMCCWGGPNWLHLSTGVVGADRRYVIAIASMQPVDEVTARSTITETVKSIFPGGRV